MTQGSDKWVDLYYYSEYANNTQKCIDQLRKDGYSIVATTPHENDCEIGEYDISKKSAFFFGKESTGLSDKVLDQADKFVKIPMYGFSESFNVSVSAALIMDSVTGRLRKSEDIDWQITGETLLDLKIDWCIKTIQNGDQIAKKYLTENQ